MANSRLLKTILWILIPLLMLATLFHCFLMIPLWYTNDVSGHRVRVTRFARDIEGECDLTYEELDEYLCESSRMMMDILETVRLLRSEEHIWVITLLFGLLTISAYCCTLVMRHSWRNSSSVRNLRRGPSLHKRSER